MNNHRAAPPGTSAAEEIFQPILRSADALRGFRFASLLVCALGFIAATLQAEGLRLAASALGAGVASAGPAARPWWEREIPLRILDTGSCYTGVTSPSPALDASQKASLAFDVEHLHMMVMAGGLDDQEFFFSSKVAGKPNEDYLMHPKTLAAQKGQTGRIQFTVPQVNEYEVIVIEK
ncbi:MAG: hypothetical protein HY735_28610 [Verrucomicrobia bacterium]|nr:hypothetical protein [Verrucomicrobiota bacterium]